MFDIALSLLLTLSSANSAQQPKYHQSDCITPTDSAYSWFGKIARVEAVSKIEGYGNDKRYILVILNHESKTAIFDRRIEHQTRLVDSVGCMQ